LSSINNIVQHFLFGLILAALIGVIAFPKLSTKPLPFKNSPISPLFSYHNIWNSEPVSSALYESEIQICSRSKCIKARGDKFVFSKWGTFLSGINIVVETENIPAPKNGDISFCKAFNIDIQNLFLICDNRNYNNKTNLVSYTLGTDLRIHDF